MSIGRLLVLGSLVGAGVWVGRRLRAPLPRAGRPDPAGPRDSRDTSGDVEPLFGEVDAGKLAVPPTFPEPL